MPSLPPASAALRAMGRSPSKLPCFTSWCLGEQGQHQRALDLLERAALLAEDPWLVAGLGLRVAEQILWAFEGRGAVVLATEAAALAAGGHRRVGRGRAAVVAAARARVLAGRCQGLDTPATRDPGVASPLSSRERQVAELAAAGRTNRQIAHTLVVSERTIENHLYRVFHKLGLSSRDELAGALLPTRSVACGDGAPHRPSPARRAATQ